LEVRWDHACNGSDAFGGPGTPGINDAGFATGVPDEKNEVMVAANVIHKF
jgi:hypothetical protein